MRNVKLWRTRLRPLISSLILFGLGVTACLMFLQMSQNSGIDGGAIYANSQEYQPPQQMPLQQSLHQSPCDTTNNGKELSSTEMKYSRTSTITSSKLDESSQRDEIIDNEITSGPTVWVITPTFYRPEQKAELTRLAQALLPVRHFVHWILVEDISHGSNHTHSDLLQFMANRFSRIEYTVLKSLPPQSHTKIVGRPRGVGGRRAAIEWLRKQFQQTRNGPEGVVYFADDDNTYDTDIFRQMRETKKVTMWPVGLVTDFGVSSPIVQNGNVVGFYDGWSGLRKFPVDMAGFAINIKLFLDKPEANMPWVAGYEEDELLKRLGVKVKDIRPLANNCTEILVWHTKAEKHTWPKQPRSIKPGLVGSTNLRHLLKSLPQKAFAGPGAKGVKGDSGFSLINMIFGGA